MWKRKKYSWDTRVKVPSRTARRAKNRSAPYLQNQDSNRLVQADNLFFLEEQAESTSPVELVDHVVDSYETPKKPAFYDGSKVTEDEVTLLVISFISKHKLTKEASKDLLALLNFVLPADITIPANVSHIRKKLPPELSITSTHYYCPNCEGYLNTANDNLTCDHCGVSEEISTLDKKGSYFLTFDMKRQLENMLTDKDVSADIFQRISKRNSDRVVFEFCSDIMDGKMYKDLGLVGSDLSCTFNTDGVPLYKSSNFSAWPILFCVNEMNYRLRVRNILIASLWFGKSKPNFETIFHPFVKECRSLSATSKIEWRHKEHQLKSHIYFPICVADSPARCQCQGTTQFNGAYGCSWCLTKGEALRQNDKFLKWTYPYPYDIQLRTKQNFLEHLRKYSEMLGMGTKLRSHFGVKTASQLILLPKFDISTGFVFDFMHAAFLGVSRTFTNAWINSKYHNMDFYIGRRINEINEKLTRFLVPRSFSRAVRTLNDVKFWKASEWRTWTYICLNILDGILPDKFVKHFSKFVNAIMILCGQMIHSNAIDIAQEHLSQFVSEVEILYGKEFCSFNCHSLLHASKCVEDWGPLYEYSAFQFENFNGILTNIFNGFVHVDTQISTRLNELLQLYKLSTSLPKSSATEFAAFLLRNTKYRKKSVLLGSVLFFGDSMSYFLPANERLLLEKEGLYCSIVKCFQSCLVNSLLFTVLNSRSEKRCDCIAELNGDHFLIRKIFIANSLPLCLASRIIMVSSGITDLSFNVSRISKDLTVLSLCHLTSKFLLSNLVFENLQHIVKLPNAIEFE